MRNQEQFKVEFHPDARARFTELAQEVLKSVRSFGSPRSSPSRTAEIHPVANITADDVIGEIRVIESSSNLLLGERGRYWTSNGLRVGWEGPEFDAIKDLARKFENSTPIKGLVSHRFLLDEIFNWLTETLEAKRSDTLPEHIAQRCSSEIRDYEIWVPVYRTYSASDFAIGDVEFRTVSKALLDRWYAHIPEDEAKKPEMAQWINRKRARIQGSIAARIRIRAEVNKAREVAQSAASEAVGFLRFLSPVNWTCRLVSHCLPVGKENTRQATELFIEDDAVKNVVEASIEEGPPGWNIDEARHVSPGLLEALHKLTLNRNALYFAVYFTLAFPFCLLALYAIYHEFLYPSSRLMRIGFVNLWFTATSVSFVASLLIGPYNELLQASVVIPTPLMLKIRLSKLEKLIKGIPICIKIAQKGNVSPLEHAIDSCNYECKKLRAMNGRLTIAAAKAGDRWKRKLATEMKKAFSGIRAHDLSQADYLPLSPQCKAQTAFVSDFLLSNGASNLPEVILPKPPFLRRFVRRALFLFGIALATSVILLIPIWWFGRK